MSNVALPWKPGNARSVAWNSIIVRQRVHVAFARGGNAAVAQPREPQARKALRAASPCTCRRPAPGPSPAPSSRSSAMLTWAALNDVVLRRLDRSSSPRGSTPRPPASALSGSTAASTSSNRFCGTTTTSRAEFRLDLLRAAGRRACRETAGTRACGCDASAERRAAAAPPAPTRRSRCW